MDTAGAHQTEFTPVPIRAVSKVLETSGITPVPHDHTLRGITNQVTVYAIP